MAALGTQAIVGRSIIGNKRYHWGTCSSGAAAGHVATGLKVLDSAWLEAQDKAYAAKSIINCSAGTEGDDNGSIYVADTNTVAFRWHAIGR